MAADGGLAPIVDLLATYAGQARLLKEWSRGAEINTDRNLRIQYLAGMSLNTDLGDSILTDILPAPVFVRSADLHVPANRDTPIAATLEMSAAAGSRIGRVTADFDFLQQGEQTWSIVIDTADGRLDLTHGGTRLMVDGAPVMAEPDTEYQRIYRHFHRLIGDGASGVDGRPLSLVADACMVGRWHRTDAFDW